jgi:DNA-binding NtrC family response regulator
MATEGIIGPEHLDSGVPPMAPADIDIGSEVRREVPLHQILADVERRAIIEALQQSNGDHGEAARRLGIYRGVLEEKIREHGIGRPASL